MAPYDPATKVFYTFFSKLSPSKFAKKLIKELQEQDVAAVISENKWKIDFQIEEELDDQEIENEVKPFRIGVQVELLQLQERKDVIAVNFKKVSGNKQFFRDFYERIKDQLEN